MANWPDTDDSFDDISAHGRSWNASSTDALPTESLAAEPAGNTASSAKKPGKHARCLMKLEKDLNKMREKLAEKAESMAVQQMQTEMFHNFQQLTLSAKGDQRFVMLLVLVNTLVVALGIAFGVWMQTVPSGRCDADLANMQDSLGRFQLAAARCEDFETRLFKVEASAGVLDNYYLPPPMCDGITPEEPGTQPSAVLLATIGCVGSVVVLLILTIQLRLQIWQKGAWRKTDKNGKAKEGGTRRNKPANADNDDDYYEDDDEYDGQGCGGGVDNSADGGDDDDAFGNASDENEHDAEVGYDDNVHDDIDADDNDDADDVCFSGCDAFEAPERQIQRCQRHCQRELKLQSGSTDAETLLCLPFQSASTAESGDDVDRPPPPLTRPPH
eukprot:TRINITY_DN22945_c0_g1_i3.p1 TRINITY_DN22945_c0_g1~~TRINITY_DN22945_c0_g1_i3.p1  ORF type:complete len:424 (-),score=80.83 TRINITY_DN22945_c0_g1_i3:142-1299(-)